MRKEIVEVVVSRSVKIRRHVTFFLERERRGGVRNSTDAASSKETEVFIGRESSRFVVAWHGCSSVAVRMHRSLSKENIFAQHFCVQSFERSMRNLPKIKSYQIESRRTTLMTQAQRNRPPIVAVVVRFLRSLFVLFVFLLEAPSWITPTERDWHYW